MGASFFLNACAAQIKLHHTVRFVHVAHELSSRGYVTLYFELLNYYTNLCTYIKFIKFYTLKH